MQIEIKYFGMIAEQTSKESEQIEVAHPMALSDLKDLLLNKYPGLKNIHFTFAIDMELTSDLEEILSSDCEIALLPAFAGG